METNLRPLGLGEILDRTAELYRHNFVLFAGIFAPYAGAALVLNLLLLGLELLLKNLHVGGTHLLITIVAGIAEMLILGILFGPVVASVSRAVAWVNMGQPATIRGAYAATLPRLGRYLWLMAISAFVVYTPFALLYAGFIGFMAYNIKGFGTAGGIATQQAAMADPKSMIAIGIASLAFLILIFPVGAYTIFMGLRYALALPACVVEDTSARPSLRRAIDLSKGARGRIFVLGLLVLVIKIGLVGITQIFTIAGIVKNHGQLGPGLTAISQIIGFFTNTFLGPIYATGITLLYYDQRVRKEGFDIEWMMQAAGLTAPAPIQEAGTPPSQLTPQLPPQLEAHIEHPSPADPAALAETPPGTGPDPSPETPPAPQDPEKPHE